MGESLWRHTLVAVGLVGTVACASDPAPLATPKTPAPPTHALLTRVPAQAVSALYVNHTILRRDWKALLDANEPAAERRRLQGFVESEDVDHSVVAALGADATPDNLALYRGRFTTEALQQSELAGDGAFLHHRGHALWGRHSRAAARLRQEELALGPAPAVQAAVDVIEGVQPGLVAERWYGQANTALHERWRSGDAVGLELLALGTPEMLTRMREFFEEAAHAQWLAMRVGGEPGFRLVAVAQLAEDDAASALAYGLAARLEALAARPQMRLLGLSGVLEQVVVRAEGRVAVARLAIEPQVFADVKHRFAQIVAYLRRRNVEPQQKR